jgi:hypothetical protein
MGFVTIGAAELLDHYNKSSEFYKFIENILNKGEEFEETYEFNNIKIFVRE